MGSVNSCRCVCR